MTIGIHNQPAGSSLGGSEYCVAVLAEELARFVPVEVVHHRPALTRTALEDMSDTDLSGVGLRYVPDEGALLARGLPPWRRYRELADWHRSLSAPYELFVTFTHTMPPRCHAGAGVLSVLFPFGLLPPTATLGEPLRALRVLMTRLRRLLWDWGDDRERLGSYRGRVAISNYTQQWTARRWGVDCGVIYPPVDTSFATVSKTNLILSVGRFATRGHLKNQRELVRAFGELVDAGWNGWEYQCAGTLDPSPEEGEYYRDVAAGAAGYAVRVVANLERARLRELFASAKIFWHAAGYGTDPAAHPESSEHFGIATVEAMAAGCVPVVINQGAQPELVEHGVTGLLWNTLDELKEQTMLLVRDEALRARLAAAAQARAKNFSRESFLGSYRELISPLLSPLSRMLLTGPDRIPRDRIRDGSRSI